LHQIPKNTENILRSNKRSTKEKRQTCTLHANKERERERERETYTHAVRIQREIMAPFGNSFHILEV
jgi:hypothetical protein